MNAHSQGVAISTTSGVTALVMFYVRHQSAINGTLQTGVLVLSLIGALIGLRKVLKR